MRASSKTKIKAVALTASNRKQGLANVTIDLGPNHVENR